MISGLQLRSLGRAQPLRSDKPRTFSCGREPSWRTSSSRITATSPLFLYATSAMPRASRSRRAVTGSAPNLLNSPVLSAETAVLDEFNEKLNEPDDALTSRSDKDYKAWLRVMFAGLAGLVQKRYAALTASRKARFDKWCTEWEPQVKIVSPKQYRTGTEVFFAPRATLRILPRCCKAPRIGT